MWQIEEQSTRADNDAIADMRGSPHTPNCTTSKSICCCA
jgi:hypothetical protein